MDLFPGPKRKRNRPTLSCEHCRFRKLKCSRTTPCGACIKAGDAATCSYESVNAAQKDESSSKPTSVEDALVTRIDRLESLLLSVVSKTPLFQPSVNLSLNHGVDHDFASHASQVHNSDGRSLKQLSKEFGVMKIEPNQTVYLGGEHWVSLMSQIQEFRDYLSANADELEHDAIESKKASNSRKVASLLSGTSPSVTKEELLSYIPSRNVTDMLVTRFFTFVASGIPVIHEPTFRKEYTRHWNSPTETSLGWLSLLFAILHHSELSFEAAEERDLPSHSAEYRERTIQCLIKADYTNPQNFVIETLILHIYAEQMEAQDSGIPVSLLIGICIRLAMRMGFHRDSRAYNGITPFQGEMRRRTWAMIRRMDTLYSFQLSLPATLEQGDSYCPLPQNIFNDEFGEDTRELPSPRDLSEITEVTYAIIKTRLILELGKIVSCLEKDSLSREDTSKYESTLEEVRASIPPYLQISTTQGNATMSSTLQMQRLGLDRMYQASKCILHRKFMLEAHRDQSKMQHRGSCIDAAMTLLGHQATIHLDCNLTYPQNIRRRHMYTLTTQDFYVAGMAVALDLHYGFESEPYSPSSHDISLWGYDRRDEMIMALETATEFWRVAKDESTEAAKAYGMFSFVLMKVKKANETISKQDRGNIGTAEEMSSTDIHANTFELANGPVPDFDWEVWSQYANNEEFFRTLLSESGAAETG